MSTVGTHLSHCCRRHGCKYGDAGCPVETGQAAQLYPCERCDDEADEIAGLLGDQVREMTASELFLELAVACKAADGHGLTGPVTVTVLNPDGQPTATSRRLRVRVVAGQVVVEAAQ